MSPRLAAAERHVITAARALERAAQYGISTRPAAHLYEQARATQRRVRREERS